VDLLVDRKMALAGDNKYTVDFLLERFFPVWSTIDCRWVEKRLSVCALAGQKWNIVELCVLNLQLNPSTMNTKSMGK